MKERPILHVAGLRYEMVDREDTGDRSWIAIANFHIYDSFILGVFHSTIQFSENGASYRYAACFYFPE